MAERRHSKRDSNSDRRDSPRLLERFLVRESNDVDGEWERHEGDLSLGGFSFTGTHPTFGKDVDVRFRLKGILKEIHARGEIIRVKTSGRQVEFHLRFVELKADDEMAIAKFIDDWMVSEG
jgi:PilZ domain